VKEVRALDNQYLFFHWHLQFPDVFGVRAGGAPAAEGGEDDVTGWTGGFDVVLGNPPWERTIAVCSCLGPNSRIALTSCPSSRARW
jgi:hypothetical protein